MTTLSMRSHYCGDLRSSHIGETVTLAGWVQRRRDHGGVIFLDLRDREGFIQVVFDPDTQEAFALADQVRNEFVVGVVGRVRARDPEAVNPKMAPGEIEVLGLELPLHNPSDTPPFQLDDYSEAGEDVRLRYRFIDLRRPEMQEKLRLRSRVSHFVRNYLDEQGFIDIETPVLTRATPEGARDYLVPSRTQPGRFFALPQSPQLFKQLLMVSGYDRYYQIARCFRDEDLRADRQPEFTQIDIETSFMTEQEIMDLNETMLKVLFREMVDVELPDFPVLTYAEAMQKYGSDRPDLRIPLEMIDVDDLMRDVEFKVFSGPANDDGARVAALRLPEGDRLSRKMIDDYTKFVGRYGARGLAYIRVNDRSAGIEGLQSPILKFLPDEVVAAILDRVGAQDKDIIFFGAGPAKVVNDALGALRGALGADLDLYTHEWAPCWVIDFPMFDEDGSGGWTATHHPFTRPIGTPEEVEANPGAALSRADDVVMNGHEVGGGSIRVHQNAMQKAIFRVLRIDDNEAAVKFGFLLDALRLGAPPHGGIAYGLDRLIMVMAGTAALRDVSAFPKTQSATCMLTEAPGEIDEEHLSELNIALVRESED